MKTKLFYYFLLLLVFAGNIYADCKGIAPKVLRSRILSGLQFLPTGIESATVNVHGRRFNITRDASSKIKLFRGVNRIRVKSGDCKFSQIVVAVPKMFFRPYLSQDLSFTRLIANPVGMPDTATPAISIADSLRETTPHLDPEIPLGLAIFGQVVAHDLTKNAQHESGVSSNPVNPENNADSPFFDLSHIYGSGPEGDDQTYQNYSFLLTNDGNDILRTEDGVPLLPDARDDITGPTLQIHLLFKRYHNEMLRRYLRGIPLNKLSGQQKRWLFETVRNRVIGMYQGIVIHQLSTALLGRELNTNYPPLTNIQVEFSAAGFRIGHTLIPNQIQIDLSGTETTVIDPALRGPSRTPIPWSLLIGDSAQKSARFDNQISPVMQELIIPLSPTHTDLGKLVGGNTQNIGAGRIVDGTIRLDLSETNILRAREQGLPTGEEVLAFMEGRTYDYSQGATDLWFYILQEAANNGFKYGKVGAYVYENTVGGMLTSDKYSIKTRKYTRREKRRFKRATLEHLVGIAY